MMRKHALRKALLMIAVATGVLSLSACTTIGTDPYRIERSFAPEELAEGLEAFAREAGTELAIDSVAGVVNGYATISDLPQLDEVRSLGDHRWVRREFYLFEDRSPLLYGDLIKPAGVASAEAYYVPLVQAVTFAPLDNEFRPPERTHLGITHIVVGPTGGHDVVHDLDAERVHFGRDGMVSSTSVETHVHPGIEYFPREIDPYIDYPIVDGRRYTVSEVPVRTIQRRVLPIERSGIIVGYRTLYEGFSIGQHNVYLALVLDSTVPGYTGKVGAVVFSYESEEAFRDKLRNSFDQDGFNILTGYNASGFNREGRARDGRRFEGRLTRAGRSGLGTTIFPEEREVTGRYVADELVGIAVEVDTNGNRLFGHWNGNVKDGEYVHLPAEGTPQIVNFRDGEPTSSRPYANPLGSRDWVWLADVVPDSAPQAVSLDGQLRLWMIDDSEVLIENRTGHQYSGPLNSTEPTEARILYADGSSYSGEVIDRTPNGHGRLTRPDSTILEGSFTDGLPDGTMLRITDDTVAEVRYYQGRQVDEDDEEELRSNGDQSVSIEQYIRRATSEHEQFVGAVRTAKVEDVLSTMEAVASISMQAAQAVADVMEEYNREAARQQAAMAAMQNSSQVQGPARGRAWSNGQPDAVPGGQLAMLVEGAEAYYQQYLAAHQRGDTASASELYRGHELTVRNAEQLARQLQDAGPETRSDGPGGPSSQSPQARSQSSGDNPCVDYDGPGECVQEQ